jgi:predicted RNA-binding protein with PUA domain
MMKSECKACGRPTDYVYVVTPGKVYPCCKRNLVCMSKLKEELGNG